MNLTVVAGRVERPPTIRQLRTGNVVTFEVTPMVEAGGRPEPSVPVSWPEPSSGVVGLREGDEVVVVGRVRRRFFRVGPQVQSRTEVAADEVLRARQRAKVRRALTGASETLAELGG